MKGVRINNTIDAEFLSKAVPDSTRIYVVEGSDEMLQVAVDPDNHRTDLATDQGLSAAKLKDFATIHTNRFQRHSYLNNTYKVHADDGSGEHWDAGARRCNDFIKAIRSEIDF